ncbi:hypothetical protein BpHYR1_037145 [Brachionus plicatilis]|uniref:Uncharacterized protein n=1 Tax=Brachionus plicatilis TaxID=10195 RepID=A0A3M7T201_BRAPC|nr:hypothetical protein BpHYR1_037145 [Brachionus plicatilis]
MKKFSLENIKETYSADLTNPLDPLNPRAKKVQQNILHFKLIRNRTKVSFNEFIKKACFAFAGLPGFLFSPIGIFFTDNGISHPGIFRIFDIPIKCMQMLFLMYHLHESSIIPALHGFAKPILNWWFDLHSAHFKHFWGLNV